MPTANQILHDQTMVFASYLTWVTIPDVQNAASQEARDKIIESFQADILYRLTTEAEFLAGSALFVYTYFDTQDEAVRLRSWQDITEAATGTLAVMIGTIITRVEYLCNKAKACEFVAPDNRAQRAAEAIVNIEDLADGGNPSSSHQTGSNRSSTDEERPLVNNSSINNTNRK